MRYETNFINQFKAKISQISEDFSYLLSFFLRGLRDGITYDIHNEVGLFHKNSFQAVSLRHYKIHKHKTTTMNSEIYLLY